ncbi:MAG: TerB family tellurite resistance protein [Steroidobacteraceae bacterium]
MLAAVKSFFEREIAARPAESPAAALHRAHLAAAALLVEVVRSDERMSPTERQSILDSVQRKFSLTGDEARQLLELAELESREAHDLHQFTSQINNSFSEARKTQLLEELWRVAYADQALQDYEEHLIRRVADLLHLRHATFIATKLRAQGARPAQ